LPTKAGPGCHISANPANGKGEVMQELITINKTQIVGKDINAVNGRDLHAFLEVGKVFAAWMPEQIEAFGFEDHKDFETYCNPKTDSSIIGVAKEYILSISMAKELSMVQRTEKGKEARLYFIKCEEMLVQSMTPTLPDFTNPVAAARAWADQVEARQALECKVEAQTGVIQQKQDRIELLEPRAKALYRIATATEGSFNLTECAKNIQMSPSDLIEHMCIEGWLYRRGNSKRLLAYQDKIDRGYLEHKVATIEIDEGRKEKTVTQVMVTSKGMAKLSLLFEESE
jgi:anti-repressor protein